MEWHNTTTDDLAEIRTNNLPIKMLDYYRYSKTIGKGINQHYVYINLRDAQILVNNLYFFVKWLYMFRTIISPSSGATFNKLYSATGTFVPVRLVAVWIYEGVD